MVIAFGAFFLGFVCGALYRRQRFVELRAAMVAAFGQRDVERARAMRSEAELVSVRGQLARYRAMTRRLQAEFWGLVHQSQGGNHESTVGKSSTAAKRGARITVESR